VGNDLHGFAEYGGGDQQSVWYDSQGNEYTQDPDGVRMSGWVRDRPTFEGEANSVDRAD